jgi:hypothetical protein
VLTSTATHRLPTFYALQARAVGTGNSAGSLLAQSDCEPTRWQAGQTVFTWLTAPTSAAAPPAPQPPAWSADRIVLNLTDHTTDFWTSSIGPIHLLSGVRVDSPTLTMLPDAASSGASGSIATSVTPDGQLILPLGRT